MQISLINDPKEIREEDWYEFILNHPFGNYFQSPALFKLYSVIFKEPKKLLFKINVVNHYSYLYKQYYNNYNYLE